MASTTPQAENSQNPTMDTDPNNPMSLPATEQVDQKTFMTVAWFATGFTLTFLVFRIAIRLRSFKTLFVDDYLVVFAWLTLLVSTILWQVKVHLMFWEHDVAAGRRPYSPEFIDGYASFIRLIIVWTYLFYFCVWAVKYSFLLFFRRLGSSTLSSKYWWFVTVLTTIGLIGCVADHNFACVTSDIMFIFTQCPRRNGVLRIIRNFYANMAVDVITDILIMTIPFMLLWNTTMALRKKLALSGLFSLSILVVVAAIVRSALVFRESPARNASIDWLYLWYNIEMMVAIPVACLGSFRQLYMTIKKTTLGAADKTSTLPRLGLLTRLGITRLTDILTDRRFHNGSKRIGDLEDGSVNPISGAKGSWLAQWSVNSVPKHPEYGNSAISLVPLSQVHIRTTYGVTTLLAHEREISSAWKMRSEGMNPNRNPHLNLRVSANDPPPASSRHPQQHNAFPEGHSCAHPSTSIFPSTN